MWSNVLTFPTETDHYLQSFLLSIVRQIMCPFDKKAKVLPVGLKGGGSINESGAV